MGNKKRHITKKRANRRRVTLKVRFTTLRSWGQKLAAKSTPLFMSAFVGLAIPYLAMQAYYFVGSSTYFAVETVDVSGLERASASALLKSASIQTGMNIFEVDPERVEPIMEASPWVSRVWVETELPRSVRVHVTEHQPAALLVAEDAIWVLDPSGVAFKSLDAKDDVDGLFEALPLMTGIEVNELQLPYGKTLFAEALEALEVYQVAKLDTFAPLSEVHLDRVLGISLVTRGGVEVRLGRGQFEMRIRRLSAVMHSLNEDGLRAEYILVDHEDDLDRVSVGMAPISGMDAAGAQRW